MSLQRQNATPTSEELDRFQASLDELIQYSPITPSLDPPTLTSRLLARAFESHPRWNPLSPRDSPPALYNAHDFVSTMRKTLVGIDRAKLTTGDAKPADAEAWRDCVGRTSMIHVMITDTTGKMAMMMGGKPVDFGEEVKAKSEECCKCGSA